MILLPPSEGKTDASGRSKLNFSSLSYPELNNQREELVTALIKLANGPKAKALSTLAISGKQEFEIQRDQKLLTAPTANAWSVYTGVLYDAIGIPSLSASAMKKFESSSFVVSALFGLINVADKIPAYRFSGDTVLPKIGSLTKFWGDSITKLIANSDEFVVDLRSGIYVKLGPTPKSISDQVLVPRVMQKMPTGKPKVVSHSNKATKGKLVRAFSQTKNPLATVDQWAALATSIGADVEVVKPAKSGTPWGLDVIVEVL
jgi:cytoplasmic iron level regulating protein YaaA (DUF328/UPF0246 family)